MTVYDGSNLLTRNESSRSIKEKGKELCSQLRKYTFRRNKLHYGGRLLWLTQNPSYENNETFHVTGVRQAETLLSGSSSNSVS